MAAINSGFYKKLGQRAAAFVAACCIAAVPFIQDDEGRRLVPYKDIAGIWTDCDGNTTDVIPGRVRTHAECDKMTQKDVERFANNVARTLQVEVGKETFVSHIRFSYNVGMGAYNQSSIVRRTNQGDIAGGCEAMMLYVCYRPPANDPAPRVTTPGQLCYSREGNRAVSKGLYNRRVKERAQCLAGIKEKK